MRTIIALAAVIPFFSAAAADIPTELPPSTVPKVPVPKSPYIAVVYKYADTMLAKGRDTFGPKQTGLFLSALDRATLAPLTNLPATPKDLEFRATPRNGVQIGPLTGAHALHDENLLRLLYTLSELTLKPAYRDAADAELKWFLQNNEVPFEGWDVVEDKPVRCHIAFRPWLLWDRCFELSPVQAKKSTDYFGSVDSQKVVIPPRNAGHYIRGRAVAYAHTKDMKSLEAISSTLDSFEKKIGEALSKETDGPVSSATSLLSLAIDCDGSAHRVPEPLATRLRRFASQQDSAFCALSHDLKGTSGFIYQVGRVSPLWTSSEPHRGRYTTSQVGMMCVSRYENSGHTGLRDLMHQAADAYLKSLPGPEDDVWPGTLGHAISLELAAWRSTSKQIYFDRARELGDFALEKFFGDKALPRASLKSEHYESITGGDSLVLALLELHLSVLHITAVRCPSNTIDR